MNPSEVEQSRLYEVARSTSLEISIAAAERGHPCVKGNGECCIDEAAVLPQDIELLQEKFRNGTLDIQILEEDIGRVAQASGACPFLDEEKNCTVYHFRPLICVYNNGLYLPGGEANAKKVNDIIAINGNDSQRIALKYLAGPSCSNCFDECNESSDTNLNSVSVEDLVKSQAFFTVIMALVDHDTYRVVIKSVPEIIEAFLS